MRPGKGAPLRPQWELWHKGAGWIALALAVPTIMLGLDRIDAAPFYLLLYCILPAAFAALFVLGYYRADRTPYAVLQNTALNSEA